MKWSKWAFRAFCKLWKKYKRKAISFEDVKTVLKIDDRSIAVLLSDLNKCSWLTSKANPDIPRRKLYKLEPLQKVIDNIAND